MLVCLHVSTYRVENPGSTVPGRGIEDGPQVEEEHGSNTTAIHGGLGVIGWLGNLDVRTNDPQADGTANSTDQEQVTATDVINEIQQPNEGNYGLDNTEDTGGQKTSVGTSNANTLQNQVSKYPPLLLLIQLTLKTVGE